MNYDIEKQHAVILDGRESGDVCLSHTLAQGSLASNALKFVSIKKIKHQEFNPATINQFPQHPK